MINYMQIENFKSLRRVALPLQRLNLFFGMNGMGKSSVIQSLLLLLLLLRQSFWENQKSNLDYLHTNGELIRLGTERDIYCQSSGYDVIRFYVQNDDGIAYDCNYQYDGVGFGSDQLERQESSWCPFWHWK